MRINNQTYSLTYVPTNYTNQPKGIKSYNKKNNLMSVPSENIIASKGLNFRARNLNSLYDEYNWYINNDHTPAVDAFLKIDDDKEGMDSFLGAILNTNDRSYQFIDSIVRQPRNSNKIIKALTAKVEPNSLNVMPFMPNSPYRIAYNKYLDNKFENSHTLSELLRVRPDWKGEKLLEKHRRLKGNDSLEIGSIPKEFPNNHLFQIADYLQPFMENGVKLSKDINSLKLDNRNYEFKFFTEGKSDKNVFGVFTPEHKKYVIKMADPQRRSLDDPFSLGTLAKIDTYLTTNRSRNSAPLCYYNHDRNMSVYKYIEHTPIPNGNQRNNDMVTIAKHIPDFGALGLAYNDTVGDKNYFLLDKDSNEDLHTTEGFEEAIKNGEWISVDNDHVTYSSTLQPSNPKYTASLPNAMQMFF